MKTQTQERNYRFWTKSEVEKEYNEWKSKWKIAETKCVRELKKRLCG